MKLLEIEVMHSGRIEDAAQSSEHKGSNQGMNLIW